MKNERLYVKTTNKLNFDTKNASYTLGTGSIKANKLTEIKSCFVHLFSYCVLYSIHHPVSSKRGSLLLQKSWDKKIFPGPL